jgi:hypothetical protein
MNFKKKMTVLHVKQKHELWLKKTHDEFSTAPYLTARYVGFFFMHYSFFTSIFKIQNLQYFNID